MLSLVIFGNDNQNQNSSAYFQPVTAKKQQPCTPQLWNLTLYLYIFLSEQLIRSIAVYVKNKYLQLGQFIFLNVAFWHIICEICFECERYLFESRVSPDGNIYAACLLS